VVGVVDGGGVGVLGGVTVGVGVAGGVTAGGLGVGVTGGVVVGGLEGGVEVVFLSTITFPSLTVEDMSHGFISCYTSH
jgi:hypothetical protein